MGECACRSAHLELKHSFANLITYRAEVCTLMGRVFTGCLTVSCRIPHLQHIGLLIYICAIHCNTKLSAERVLSIDVNSTTYSVIGVPDDVI